jgi:hypothetical protein
MTKTERKLDEIRESVKFGSLTPLVDLRDFISEDDCRGDEDCDHCFRIQFIDQALAVHGWKSNKSDQDSDL